MKIITVVCVILCAPALTIAICQEIRSSHTDNERLARSGHCISYVKTIKKVSHVMKKAY